MKKFSSASCLPSNSKNSGSPFHSPKGRSSLWKIIRNVTSTCTAKFFDEDLPSHNVANPSRAEREERMRGVEEGVHFGDDAGRISQLNQLRGAWRGASMRREIASSSLRSELCLLELGRNAMSQAIPGTFRPYIYIYILIHMHDTCFSCVMYVLVLFYRSPPPVIESDQLYQGLFKLSTFSSWR